MNTPNEHKLREDLLRAVRLTGGCRADADDLRVLLGGRHVDVRHALRQVAMGMADDHVLTQIEQAFHASHADPVS